MVAAVRFVAFALGLGATADELDCTPPVMPESGLKVAFHDNTRTDICHLQQPPLENNDMASLCSAFCATNGREEGLPMVLGSEQFGFNLEEMVEVCTNISSHNESLSSYCSRRADSLTEIQVKAAQFVAKVNIFKAEQVAFRAGMQQSADNLRQRLVSEEFQIEMDRAVDKAGLLKTQFTAITGQAASQAGQNSQLLAAIRAVKAASDQLSTVVNSNLAYFQEFVDNCNTMLLATGSQSEFLLDICGQLNVACIEDPLAGHVGCCCGLNPVVMRTHSYTIDGLSAAVFGGSGSVGVGRRLTGVSAPVDVCGQAKRDSEQAIADAENRTTAMGGAALIQERREKLQSNYPSYYSQCGGGRRLGGDGRRLGDESQSQWDEPEEVRRELSLQCIPPVADQEGIAGLKVAFSHSLESNICNLQSPPLNNSEMVAQCNEFCAPYATPMLMGSERYGFNFEAANNICVPPDGLLKHDPALLQQCHSWAQAFAQVEVKTAQFIAQLDIFIAAQLLYMAELRNTTRAIRTFVLSEDFKDQMSLAIDKVQTLTDAISQRLQQDNVVAAKTRLDTAIAGLKSRASELQTLLDANIEKMQNYLEQCNHLFVGIGAQNEYVLDICAQKSSACIESPVAGHVSCCCAYHPFTAFGDTARATTIEGISGFPYPARVAAGRRLQAGDDAAFEICKEAWSAARPTVREMFTTIRATDEATLNDYLRQVQGEYGGYCHYEEGVYYEDSTTESTTTSQSTTTTSQSTATTTTSTATMTTSTATTTTTTSTATMTTSTATTTTRTEGFYWVTDVCGKSMLEPRTQSQHSYAAVRCCDLAGESAMTPTPCQVETFPKADEICTELGMTLCSSSNVYLACGTGCHNNRLVWTKSSAAPESATTENVVLEGDFDSVVGSKQGVFLEECSASLSPVKCVTVEAGSILVTLGSEDRTALEQALDNIGTSGLSLPSFRHLYKVADDEASAATNLAVLFPFTFLAAVAAALVG